MATKKPVKATPKPVVSAPQGEHSGNQITATQQNGVTPASIDAGTKAFTDQNNTDDLGIANNSGFASTAENNATSGATNTFTPLAVAPNYVAQVTTPTDLTGTDANTVLVNGLKAWGLDALSSPVAGWIAKGYSPSTLADMIRTYKDPSGFSPYNARFPAMAGLSTSGHALTEAQYLAKENQDRELLYNYLGPSAKNYDNPTGLGGLMTNFVSSTELQSRLQAIHDEVNASPETKAWLKQTYGLSDQDVAAAWLDPKLAQDQVTLRDQSGAIGGAGATSGFGQLTQAQAEALATQGVTQSQAQNTFAKIGNFGQLEQNLPGNDSGSLTQQQILNGAFNGGAAGATLAALQASRVAQFNLAVD